MNILLIYGDEPGTSGRYLKNSLSKKHNVITCGPNTKTGKPQDIKTSQNIIDIESIIKKIKPQQKPDLVLQIDSPFRLYLRNLSNVKAKTVLFWTDVTIKLPVFRHYAKCFDYLLVPSESLVPIVTDATLKNIFVLHFAVDPQVHKDYHLPRKIDVGFVGHLSTFYNPKRTFYLEYLASKIPLTVKTETYENEMSNFYSQCKIVFNLSVTPGINMRTFEALACGTLLVQNASCTDIPNHFINGQDLVLYRSPKEAVDLIRYYLAHPKERERIARAGQKKALKNHIYQKRAEQFIKIIRKSPPQREPNAKIKKSFGKTLFMSNLTLKTRAYNFPKPIIARIIPHQLHPLMVYLIKQIETFQFRWTIPFWYIALFVLRLKNKMVNRPKIL